MSDSPLWRRNHTLQPKALTPDYRSSRLRAPTQALLHYAPTASEMTGPVFQQGQLQPLDADLIINHATDGQSALGPRIQVHGTLKDQTGRPLAGKLIEIWQANAGGRYRHRNDSYLAPLDPNFGGCGRCLTDDQGRYRFRTIQPGAYPWPNGGNDWRPAHIHFSVFGEGFAQRLITQMYFEGDPHIPLCPIVNSIPDASAIDRLVARLDMHETVPMDLRAYRFDLTLRGRDATWFENRPEGL